jgi:inner membrane protein
MILTTHITFSWTFFFVVLAAMGIVTDVWTITAISIGAILPDIDTQSSTVGKLFPWVSRRIERRWGHRTITHSWLSLLIITILLIPISYTIDVLFDAPLPGGLGGSFQLKNSSGGVNTRLLYLSTAFCVGLWTHSILDTCTIQGVKILYPLSTRKGVFPLDMQFPHSFRTSTGSRLDRMLTAIFFITALATFPLATVGYQRLIRFLHKDMTSAINDYQEFIKTHSVVADISAINAVTRQTVLGTFPIVGILTDDKMLFEKEGRLFTIGNSITDHYTPERIVCHKEVPIHADIKYVDLSDQFLKNVSFYFPKGVFRAYMFGELTATNNPSIPHYYDRFNTISASSSKIKLEYATMQDISEMGLLDCLIQSGSVMIKALVLDSSGFPGAWDYLDTARIQQQTTVLLSFQSKTEPRVLVSIGDTVNENQPLAVESDSELSYTADSDVFLNQLQMDALDMQHKDKTDALKASLSLLLNDSLRAFQSYIQKLDHQRLGYVSEAHVNQSYAELLPLRTKIKKLIDDMELSGIQYKVDVQSKRNAISNLQRKELKNAHYLKSPYRGTVQDIRFSSNKNQKTEITFYLSIRGNQ